MTQWQKEIRKANKSGKGGETSSVDHDLVMKALASGSITRFNDGLDSVRLAKYKMTREIQMKARHAMVRRTQSSLDHNGRRLLNVPEKRSLTYRLSLPLNETKALELIIDRCKKDQKRRRISGRAGKGMEVSTEVGHIKPSRAFAITADFAFDSTSSTPTGQQFHFLFVARTWLPTRRRNIPYSAIRRTSIQKQEDASRSLCVSSSIFSPTTKLYRSPITTSTPLKWFSRRSQLEQVLGPNAAKSLSASSTV